MKALILLLALIVAVIAGYVMGRWNARREGITKAEREELKQLRDLRYWLIRSAAEHQALGDDYAVIVGAQLDDYFRKGIS